MKKIFTLFSIAMFGALVASCNINEYPTFDDKDAFAAFTSNSMTVKEDVGTVNIPVHLTSLGGVATTVTYEFVNGTAKQGVDFEDASGSGSISFAAGESEKYITVKVLPHLGEYTGDLSFSVKFKSVGDVKMGSSNSCNVTITDIDHPLSDLLGTYSGEVFSQWDGDNWDWTITISKDDSDVTKVWISDWDPYFASYGYASSIYGLVNAEKTQITIPSRQAHVASYETAIVGFDSVDPYEASTDTDIIIMINEDGTLTIPNGWGVFYTGDGYDYVLWLDDEYYNVYDGGGVLKKQ